MSCHGHGVVVCCVSEVVPTNICFGVCVCVFFYVSVSSWKIFSKFVRVEDGRALDWIACLPCHKMVSVNTQYSTQYMI